MLKKNVIIKFYLLFIFFCAISYFVAKNTSLVFTKITEILIIFCLFINLLILLKNKLDLIYKIAFVVSISAFLQAWQQLAQFVITPKQTDIITLLNGMKGNTGNINILAASLTIKVPFILLAIYHFTNYRRLFFTITLFSVTTIIFLTGARTALINIFLLSIVYIVFLFRKSTVKKTTFIKVLFIAIPILLAVIFSNSIFSKSKNTGRYVSLENRVSKINTEDESSKARLVFWNNVLKMSKKNPVFGIGLGNYQIESIPYERTTSNDSNVSLHAHNDFLEILAETGIINGIIYFSIFVFLLFINVKSIIKPIDKESQEIAVLGLMLLIVYGLDSLFNFPMYRPTMAIFFSLLLALSLLNNFKTFDNVQVINNFKVKFLPIILILISLMTSYSAYLIYKASNLEYLIATDDINMNEKGVLTGDEVVRRMPVFPNVLSSSESFYEYAAIYYIREKKYSKALKCFSRASKINGYNGRIEFYKSVISRYKENLDSAYIYSKQAFYLRPRNYGMYKSSINYAISRKDTLEILKEHTLFNSYRPMSETWIQAANGLQSSGYNYKNLMRFIDKGLKVFPKDSMLNKQKKYHLVIDYIVKGQTFERQSKFKEALEMYENALKIDSQNVYALQNIGFYYYNRGEYTKAISFLVDALKYPGLNDGKTEFYLGMSYLAIRNNESADKYFNISKNKKYISEKQLETNIKNTKSEEEIANKRKRDLLIADYITIGQKFEDEKKLDQALKSYQKALKIDPNNIYAFQNIGFYYLKIRQYEKAINCLLNALKYPGLNDGKTEYFLAISYLNVSDKNNACKYLNISKNKKYPNAESVLENTCK
ncbi:O-antigen ligase family protein [Flavobacterium sp. UW10123]|uniref:O-antigen ligase family protein n=1 Tax=Flavobacterium sp. UW10123 TaxID=3230800 RepID=UPI003391E71D